MKKLLTLALGTLLLTACTPEPSLPRIPATEIRTRGFTEEESPITAETIRVDSQGGTFRFINETGERFYYGSIYKLEQRVGNDWFLINPEMDFTLEAVSLEAHDSIEIVYNWSWYFEDDLPSGAFRIRKVFGRSASRQYEAVIEFVLE